MHLEISMETMFPVGSIVVFNDNCLFWDKTIMYIERYDNPDCPVGAFGIMFDHDDEVTTNENFTPICMEDMRFATPDEMLSMYYIWCEHWNVEKIQRVIKATANN